MRGGPKLKGKEKVNNQDELRYVVYHLFEQEEDVQEDCTRRMRPNERKEKKKVGYERGGVKGEEEERKDSNLVPAMPWFLIPASRLLAPRA